ncbi:MAG: HD-GYP domain-containing protein [Suipraeoptans sp.]
MKFRMDQLLHAFSIGFDSVEADYFDTTSNHGRRIALLCIRMSKYLGLSNDMRIGIAYCAILHDNALTETFQYRNGSHNNAIYKKQHCLIGESNASYLSFPCNVTDIIKYHHEYVDKSGPFKTNANVTPIGAQLIAIADEIDAKYHLETITPEQLLIIHDDISQKINSHYTEASATAMLGILDETLLIELSNAMIEQTLQKEFPIWTIDCPAEDLMLMFKTLAKITDYKSKFTAKHSSQIANRAYIMAEYYKMDLETCAKVYMAASVHDIGKLMTPTSVLEKPGKLNNDEFQIIKQHVSWSYIMLCDIEGFEEICLWAVTHHRKLNGTGYPKFPDGYLPDDCFVCRLMTCIDIYQAVRESRPYHSGRTHEQTMAIMYQMVDRGEIDTTIVSDLDKVMSAFPEGDGDVPEPEYLRRLHSLNP